MALGASGLRRFEFTWANCSGKRQHVAHATNRLYQLRMIGIVAQLSAQPGHPQVNRSIQSIIFESIQLQAQITTAHDLARIFCQEPKQIEFGSGQVDGLPIKVALPTRGVNLDCVELDYRCLIVIFMTTKEMSQLKNYFYDCKLSVHYLSKL